MSRRSIVIAAIVGVLLIASIIVVVARRAAADLPCRVVAGQQTYALDREQVANALIITDAAKALGLPHHAVTVAVAAALDESRLHNLPHGDRDSLGLFQQRPSQGWGTPTEILTPRYAAEAFLRALARTGGWQTMSVNDAAQRVHRSATPTAYTAYEAEARAIARATTRELPGTLTCRA